MYLKKIYGDPPLNYKKLNLYMLNFLPKKFKQILWTGNKIVDPL